MRTRVRTDIVYKYNELSDEAKQRVLEDAAQFNMEVFNTDELTANFAETLKEYGFPTDKIEWSLGHCQGDGVAFYGDIDLDTYLTKTKQRSKFRRFINADATIVRNSWGNHYSHWNTMTVELDFEHEALMESLADDVVKVSRELESRGYAEFDRVSSKEYIEEQIEANEYEFTSDGKLI